MGFRTSPNVLSIHMWGGVTPVLLGPLEKANLSHEHYQLVACKVVIHKPLAQEFHESTNSLINESECAQADQVGRAV
jgi:hypothetical protein